MKNKILFLLFLIFVQKVQSLDTSFGNGAGYVTTSNSKGFQINRLKLQSDNKIVVVGFTQDPNTKGIIVRYNTDGSLDTTFGTNGIVIATIGSTLSTTVLTDLAIQADGKIVVVGYSFDTSGTTLVAVARYNSNGTLDGGFASGGVFTATVGSGSTSNSVSLQTDQKIIVAGTASISGTPNGFVARLTTGGVLDGTFGSGGVVTGLIGIRTSILDNVIDSSGNIIVTGFYAPGTSGEQFFMAKYNSSGVIVGSFGSGGIVLGAIGNTSRINSIALDGSGNILIAGYANSGTADQFLVARYTSAGALDTTFNGVGYITALIGNGSRATDVIVQSDNKVIIVGHINPTVEQATIARYNTNGTSDTTFGSGGVVSLNVGNGSRFSAVAIQSTDQKIISGGYAIDPTTKNDFGLVARFNKNNTDNINITSIINGSTINTKIPTISGTSSAASATVEVIVNGALATTTTTDGSGNWNAGSTISFGTPLVLPIGSNTIQTNLVVSGQTIVSSEIQFTVTDNLGEDSILVYSTATQTLAGADTATAVTFNNAPLTTTWTNNGSNTLTCRKTGKYQISYNLLGQNTSILTTSTITAIIAKNGTEIAGSQTGSILSTSDFRLISNLIITNLNAGDTIQCQFAGSTTNVQLAPTGLGTALISAKINIIRLS